MHGLATWLRRRAERDVGRAALTFAEETHTYGDLQSMVEAFADFLAAQGVRAGDRVAYLGFNHTSQVVALFAVARLGAIFVPLNFRLTGRELRYVVDDSGATLLIADGEHVSEIDGIRDELAVTVHITLGEERAGWTRYDLDSADRAPRASEVDVDVDSPGVILYTSGTTGHPKGAVLTHRNLFTNNVNWMLSCNYHRGHTGLTSAPLFHSGGLCVMVLPLLMAGGHVILHQSFDPDATIETVTKRQVSTMFLVPTMMLYLTRSPRFAEADLSSLEFVVAGAAPVPESLLRVFGEHGVAVSQCWGLTETATGATFLSSERALAKVGSCGTSGVLNEVKLIGVADGEDVTGPHVAGELCVRGDTVTPGYWNLPEATADAAIPGGWFRTGDVAYRDEEGFYFICDRLKDMIITGGENVYPAEVENAVHQHGDVADVAVIGAPDEEWGERVVAVVVPVAGATVDLDGLRAFLDGRLARYKLPREVRVVAELPRNTTGKILKHVLRG
ncbi:long-chain-fatty-acid--CoA ligase [Pseudonocardia endophytica]|uniref:Fatty-acyl-CoA synthase n=1 Tax=Pseudonocardia endophytica TaxID=401976 RepID=A0A4V2PIZ2_PSEEN|nr:long-chain-fatty-acid--CoA ligase [Pseudonocardia endophytica]TCK26336.1 fatty-acyl-CoA synthase [Pseudonocardia endophytica]